VPDGAAANCPSTEVRVPERFAAYYGQPEYVNAAAGDTTAATQVFKDYGFLLLGGGGLEQSTHIDHAATQIIISNLAAYGTRVYGYIDLCVMGGTTCSNLPLSTIYANADLWKAMGVAGIFLDQVGYDYNVSRDRLNSAVDYVHSLGLSAFVNPWNPDDVFSSDTNALNPNATPTHLDDRDYSLHESFAIQLGAYQDPATLLEKADKERAWSNQTGTHIAVVNTVAQGSTFDQASLDLRVVDGVRLRLRCGRVGRDVDLFGRHQRAAVSPTPEPDQSR
jgi:hypothetical protein